MGSILKEGFIQSCHGAKVIQGLVLDDVSKLEKISIVTGFSVIMLALIQSEATLLK